MNRFTVASDGRVVDAVGQYYYSPRWADRAWAQEAADLLNRLDAGGFSHRLRGGTMYFAKQLARHDGPPGEGFIQVVRYVNPECPWVDYLAVEMPSRRSIMFALHTVATYEPAEAGRFDPSSRRAGYDVQTRRPGHEAEALAYAAELAADGQFAHGELYNPGEIAEIERLGC